MSDNLRTPKVSSTTTTTTTNSHQHRRKMSSLLTGGGSGAGSSKTGPIKGLQAFRKRNEKKRLHTSKELRQYKKVMQQHGYEPGTGAKRRRVTERSNVSVAHDANEDEHDKNETGESTVNEPTMIKKKAKTSKSVAAKAYKESKEEAAARIRKEQKRQQDERHRKLGLRKKRTELLQQKTSRGQPVMKNMVHDILAKLQKEM